MDQGETSDGQARLRVTAAAVEDLGARPGTDPMEHADRFEALHEALVAALADVSGATDARADPTALRG